MNYHKHYSTRETPQSEPIPGRTDQVKNNAGGYVWAVDDWKRLERFLVLGSEGGSYYVGERELTIRNASAVARCIDKNGPIVVEKTVEISKAGRAPKNDSALFVLAMCAGMGSKNTRRLAFDALPEVARIFTHLALFNKYLDGFRGWGRGRRNANANWYNGREVNSLAYQAIKYRKRHGWTHRDLLRMSHPTPVDKAHEELYHWITQGEYKHVAPMPDLIDGLVVVQSASNEKQVIAAIEKYKLPWEAVPTEYLGSAAVWEALLPRLPATATLRNLGRLTAIGLLKPMSDATYAVVERLTNQDVLRKARVHPIALLAALLTYNGGESRGGLAWSPVREVVEALDAAFYLSFGNVTPTDKRIVIAIDKSGSMDTVWYGSVMNVHGFTPRMAAAAMALVTANVEERYAVVGFDTQLLELNISPKMRLDAAIQAVPATGGGTNAALPMEWALDRGIRADAFIIITDNETWHGRRHPAQALVKYRQATGIPAKLVTVGMTSSEFTIADPNDAGQLDVIGYDTATPNLISDFVREG